MWNLNNRQMLKRLFIAVVVLVFTFSCKGMASDELPALLPEPVDVVFTEGWCGNPDNLALDLNEAYTKELGNEGYRLKVTRKGVRIEAATEAGAFYAKQTLSQLTKGGKAKCATITDYPRFSYRGFHLDVARHFFPKEEIFKLLDEAARYKFNNFHFHLTDNCGWRIPIDAYPLLIEKGAYRTDSDWTRWYVRKARTFCSKDAPGAYGGYYTKDELREIVSYASKLHINVIPEIEFPAHSGSVFAGYPELTCTGESVGHGEFCPANEDVYKFADAVLSEVLEIFPSKTIHIGCDEATRKDWASCPKCQALMKSKGMKGCDELQVYLIERIQKILESKGRTMAGWDEIISDPNLNSTAISYSYRGQKNGIKSANKGYRTVMCPGEVLYLDWYQADPLQERKAMGGYSPIWKMYGFNPQPSSPEETAANELLIQSKRVYSDTVGFIRPENLDNVIGVQACAWTEYIESPEHLEYMIFPRILAVGELAWTPAEKLDWQGFKARMKYHRDQIAERGINAYDLHDYPKITAESLGNGRSMVYMDCEQADGNILYTLDGSDPSAESTVYSGPFEISDEASIKAQVFIDGKAASYIRDTRLEAGKTTEPTFPCYWDW